MLDQPGIVTQAGRLGFDLLSRTEQFLLITYKFNRLPTNQQARVKKAINIYNQNISAPLGDYCKDNYDMEIAFIIFVKYLKQTMILIILVSG